MQLSVQDILKSGVERTDAALDRLLPSPDTLPHSIHRAMRHSVFAGGKRLRPILCMEAARMVLGTGALPAGIEELGSAIEMLHTYSLIHDDLPALDNDDLRRGKPTCHVVYGEAIAILAGDALQTQAFEVLGSLQCSSDAAIRIVREIAIAIGTGVDKTRPGMIGGQVMDIEGEHQKPTAEMVEAIHRAKTGALITVSLVSGGIYAGGHADAIQRLRSFGQKAGLAFQIVDDVLDVTQSSEQLGKTAGKDTASDKATWPAVFGIDQSIKDADSLITAAFAELEPFGAAAEPLKSLAHYLVERKH
ncbi:MAG: polyprenyl synthetase family protein [Acidobacteriaceae bacterium]